MTSSLFIGLMSGTSLDGVDAVVADFQNDEIKVLGHVSIEMPEALKFSLLQLNKTGADELHQSALASNALMQLYAKATHNVLDLTGLTPQAITAIGAHGQTVRHQPGLHDGIGYTIQLNNPSLLAELTQITVVADFRSRDIAAGGQGAPLVPLFHQFVFGSDTQTQAVLNLGGIANLSVLHPNGELLGFDCGPGNALMDYWCHLHTGRVYDEDGNWAREGNIQTELLNRLLQEPFLHLTPPKSTGRDLFHVQWLNEHLHEFDRLKPVDVQATLTEFTAQACIIHTAKFAKDACQVAVCGGGALNGFLMSRLQAGLNVPVVSSQDCGMPPLQVEAAAFAWLARQTLLKRPGNEPKVTGAKAPRILGGIFQA
jgi:anhydro-N-acetylmuramic acid kinase